MKKITDYLSSLLTVLKSFTYSEKELQDEWDTIGHDLVFARGSTELTSEHRYTLKNLSDWSIKYNNYLHVISQFESDESVNIAQERALKAIQYVQMLGGKVVVSCIMNHGPRTVHFYIY
jgi:hypothetical protein